MYLDSTLRKLQIVLAAAKTTLDCPVLVDYVDITATTTTPGLYPSFTNGVTAVDMLPAPAASTQRKVNGLSIYNKDTASVNVQIGLLDNATAYAIIDMVLQIDDTLCYTDTQGWYTVDSQGNLKSVQAASATAIATAIHGTTNKTTPVGADELGIWDSVTGLLNKVSFTNLWSQLNGLYASLTSVAGYPTVASATTIDIFGAAGATINVSGTTTVTGLTACTAAQAGSAKTIIPSNAAGFSITATANIVVDGATSGTYLMLKDANVQVIATSTTTFKITTIFASGTWVPSQGAGLTVVGAFSSSGTWVKIGRQVTLYGTYNGATSITLASGGQISATYPLTTSNNFTGGAYVGATGQYVAVVTGGGGSVFSLRRCYCCHSVFYH